ncbi:hypothetical protein QA648_22110 (plasmid) [Rhizobium sp. CB3171]|uniref:hypothetical protein n=1 Tax=Rhizobium sp. CB3171 TaxID=3039157 RepID=UPI0024B23CF3|nr:hypothetical protein [Rhizobium sp. CB3171]WFU05857.1 hypothetical protein QA648_22110 [Rhizobium sp. CB3171]
MHEAVSKGTHVFRCSLSGSSSGRLLEVPSWMFDRSVSGCWRSLPVPHVDLASLHILARLLKDADVSSQSSVMGAALVSHETSRRDVHASPAHDMPVRSVLGPAAGKTAGTPQWPELPEETRQALTVLIVRLFVDHAKCGHASQQKEADHDA